MSFLKKNFCKAIILFYQKKSRLHMELDSKIQAKETIFTSFEKSIIERTMKYIKDKRNALTTTFLAEENQMQYKTCYQLALIFF